MNPIKRKKWRIVGVKELKTPTLYFKDASGDYQKCHKLLPDIRRIFGDIEYIDGEPVEIIPNKERTMNTTTIKPHEIDTYYDRTINPDGTFQKKADKNNQKYVANTIRRIWKAEVTEYGQTSPIDFFIKAGEKECFADCKTSLKYRAQDHALLNMRKFCCLMDAGRLWEVPTFLFLYDKSGIYYVNAQDLGDPIECGKRIAGIRIKKAQADIEPCLIIYKKDMKRLI